MCVYCTCVKEKEKNKERLVGGLIACLSMRVHIYVF